MTEHANDTLSNDTINLLLQNGLYEGIPLIAEMLANAAMILERAEHLKVGAYVVGQKNYQRLLLTRLQNAAVHPLRS